MGGGACEVLPLRKGGGGKGFSHAEGGGGTKSFGEVFMWLLKVLAILRGVARSFRSLKAGARKGVQQES